MTGGSRLVSSAFKLALLEGAGCGVSIYIASKLTSSTSQSKKPETDNKPVNSSQNINKPNGFFASPKYSYNPNPRLIKSLIASNSDKPASAPKFPFR